MVVKGDVKVEAKGKAPVAAKVGMKVNDPDKIIAGKDARAKIVMQDKNVLNISPDTVVVIEQYKTAEVDGKKEVSLNVLYGKVRATVNQKYDGEKSKFQVKTPSAVAGVRGTDFMVSHVGNQSRIVTFEGSVSVGSGLDPSGKIENPVNCKAGEMTTASNQGPPAPPMKVPPQELQAMNKESSTDGGKRPDATNEREVATDKKEEKKEDKKEDKPTEGDKKDKGADKSENEPDGEKNAEKDGEKSPDKSADKKTEGDKSEPTTADKSEPGDSKKEGGSGSNSASGPSAGGGPKGPPLAGGPDGGSGSTDGNDRGPASEPNGRGPGGPGPGAPPMNGGGGPEMPAGPGAGPCLTCDILAGPEAPPIPQMPDLPPVLGDIYHPPEIPPDLIQQNTNLTVIINVQ